jgi:NAD(P)-dependent dehydrogenase (short-subunit alcohol dehydrogenase family)
MLDKPVALVAGGQQRIGRQITKGLAARGFTVLIGSRNLEHVESSGRSVGADACALQLEVTNQDSIAAAAERLRNELGRLDVLWTTRVRSITVRARVAAPPHYS